MEKYIVNGQGFNVAPENLEAFLKMYPTATKAQEDISSLDYKLDKDGRRMYYGTSNFGTKPKYLREVGYEYDRSKGIRFEVDSYGKYIDNFSYKYIPDIFGITQDAIDSSQSGEYTDEMNELIMKGGDREMSQQEAQNTVRLLQESSKKQVSENVKKWSKKMEEYKNPIAGFFMATAENPMAAYEATISSLAGQFRAQKDGELVLAAISAGIGSAKLTPGHPYLKIASFFRGYMSTLGGGVETASKFGELIKEEFGNRVPTEEELIEFVQDEEKFNKFRNKALAKGGTIALIDNIGGSLVTKRVLKTAKKGKKVRAAVEGLGLEAAVGGGGEAVSSKVIGEEISAVDVGLEILGQGGQSVVDVGGALVTPGKYEINGKPATLQQVQKVLDTATPQELANININVKNDSAFEAEVNRIKQKAYLETQIDEVVADNADRNELVELQTQKIKAEGDSKKTGIFAVPGSKKKLADIDAKIETIMSKYESTDRRTKDVRARKKTRLEAFKAKTESVIAEINKERKKKNQKQIKSIKDLADYIGEKSGLKINVQSGNTAQFQEYLASVDGREDYQKTLQGLELGLQSIIEDPESSVEEVNAAQEELGILKGAGQTGVAPLNQVLNIAKGESKRYGRFAPVFDDKGNVVSYDVFVNEQTSTKDGMIKTAAHEFFHVALFSTLQGNIQAQMTLGNALLRALKAKGATVKPGSTLNKQINRYKENEGLGEEIITITGENFDDVNINEGFVQDLRDIFRRFGQKYFPGKFEIRFDTDQDVLNFVKDLHKTIKDPKKINKALVAMISKGAKGKLLEGIDIEGGPKVGQAFSKEASNRVQAIYNEKGEAGAMEIIDQFKPITNRLVDMRSQAPNFDRQLLTDEIETGKRGIFDLIRSYDPSKGVPLAAYINDNLPKRAIEASKRVLGEEFTQDVTERVDIAAEEVTTPTVKRRPKKIVLADRLGIAKEVDAAVAKIIPELDLDKITFKNLKNKVPSIVGKLFGIAPKKLITNANITKGELQKSQMFISKNADLLIKMLPEGSTQGGTATGVPNSLLKAFYTKTERAKAAKTGSKAGLAIQQKNNINKKDFLEVFGIVDGKPNRDDRNTSARVLALANTLGKMITNQAVRQQVKIESFRALEDGKSPVMFSKDLNQDLANKYNIPYYKIQDNTGAETFVIDFVDRIIPIFDSGFLNTTVAISTSTMPARLVKDAKQMLISYMGQTNTEYGNNNRFSRTKFDKNSLKKSDKELQALNKRNTENFNYMWLKIFDAIKKDKTIVTPLLHWLSGSTNEGTHPQRIGAELTHIDRTATGKLELEHALPNASAYRLLIEAAINQNKKDFTKTLQTLQDNYKLIAMSKKDSNKLQAAGYKESMPEGWNIFDNNWWERYFNEKVLAQGGINPENFTSILSGNSLAEDLNINIKGQPKPIKTNVNSNQIISNAMSIARTSMFSKEIKGITILDFDDTLATTKSLVKYTAPDGATGTLNAEQFASTYQDLQDQGYTFDFSDFNKVVKGRLAPLFQKALKLQKKFGPENMFVLTARPPASQKAIFDFLKANGLNIPLKNITGLGNSTSEAKALWVADKVAEGYNDFYFADDALQNVQAVQNMLDQFDVKSKIQQAKVRFSKDMNTNFNDILQDVTGIKSEKRYSEAKARKRGEGKGKFRIFVPPSHEDFSGLLYNFIGKGAKGNKHRDFFEQALIKPLNRAYTELNAAKQAIANDYRALIKQFPEIRKKLSQKTPDGDYYYSDAVRVYLWDKAGFEIPGMSQSDIKELTDLVDEDINLQSFAEAIGIISKQKEGYVQPSENWEAGDIRTDLADATGRVGRKQFFAEFIENADVIFSQENLNKIEAAYGLDFREALEDILYRTKNGTNRTTGQNKIVNRFLDYLNGSIGATMFFNARSAVLQTLSTVNFINFGDNNIFKAAKAFANQPQFWKDFSMIFNSDMLRQRRAGTAFDVNAAELSSAISKSKEPVRAAIRHLLQIGFLPTQIADSFAISLGGSSMYRNRVNTYLKQGLSKTEAEQKAFDDFQEVAEATQQSARPDKISQEQASPLGRMILAFQNTPSQYVRLMKKAALDLINRRKTPPYKNQVNSDMSNVSKIIYYGAIQNLIFYGLQSALFAMMFDDEDKDEEFFDKKRDRVLNGSLDTILRGMGVKGAIISTIKNTAIKWAEQQGKGWGKEDNALMMEMLQLSPPIGIKARKLSSAEKTYEYNKKVIKEMETLDIDNPIWSAVGNVIEATTNIPLARLHRKTMNLRQAMNSENEWWQRLSMAMGWSQWDVGVKNEEVEQVKKKIKEKKKQNIKTKKKKSKFQPVFID